MSLGRQIWMNWTDWVDDVDVDHAFSSDFFGDGCPWHLWQSHKECQRSDPVLDARVWSQPCAREPQSRRLKPGFWETCMCIYIVFFDLPAEITWRTHIRKSETYSFDSILQEGGCVPVLDCNMFTIILAWVVAALQPISTQSVNESSTCPGNLFTLTTYRTFSTVAFPNFPSVRLSDSAASSQQDAVMTAEDVAALSPEQASENETLRLKSRWHWINHGKTNEIYDICITTFVSLSNGTYSSKATDVTIINITYLGSWTHFFHVRWLRFWPETGNSWRRSQRGSMPGGSGAMWNISWMTCKKLNTYGYLVKIQGQSRISYIIIYTYIIYTYIIYTYIISNYMIIYIYI